MSINFNEEGKYVSRHSKSITILKIHVEVIRIEELPSVLRQSAPSGCVQIVTQNHERKSHFGALSAFRPFFLSLETTFGPLAKTPSVIRFGKPRPQLFYDFTTQQLPDLPGRKLIA